MCECNVPNPAPAARGARNAVRLEMRPQLHCHRMRRHFTEYPKRAAATAAAQSWRD
jgi:hypothetical protein